MPTKQEIRSEETRRAIVEAAGDLFARRGFDSVTMREIARAAGCSHTTIYLYFKDKEALLHQLSTGPLLELQQQMEAVLQVPGLSADERLKQVSQVFLHFNLTHRNMYALFFMTRAERVDEAEPTRAISRLRNRLFGLMRQAVQGCLPSGLPDDQLLAYTRVYFYLLHGIVGTYSGSDEPPEGLLDRLASTFDLAVLVMLAGMKETVKMGVDRG